MKECSEKAAGSKDCVQESIDRAISFYSCPFKEFYRRNEASEIQKYRQIGLACKSQVWLMEFVVHHQD